MDIDEKGAAAVLTATIGWLASVFYYGRRIGSVEEQFKAVQGKTKENEDAIARLRATHDADMASIRAFFSNPDGGQKFMTFANHELVCARAAKEHAKDFQHMHEILERQLVSFDRQTAQLDIISADIAALKTDMAVVKERREKPREGA